ncbi:hypothetical protein [Streptomyces sp. NPDC056244]|uniref:hypothetical protein n=1 Tax=Streptomyces sp. NPDC056244 TaxID=3345762 RepID=UPI0035DD6F14
MPTLPTAQITLCSSRDTDIVAIAHGEQYPRAQTALQASGFQRRDNGTFALPANDPEISYYMVTALIDSAERHRTTVIINSRRYLGEVAEDLAAQLPGTWNATLSVHSHPIWQEDLVPWLWDSGELTQAVQTARVPYTATLSNGAGIELLLIERPGHDQDAYIVGAVAPEGFDDNYEEPNAPASLIAAAPELAAAITDRFLPAYQQALHARRTGEVASALARVREELETLRAMTGSGRFSDGTPLGTGVLAGATAAFRSRAWLGFQDFLVHGPALLEVCRPAWTDWPEDTDALDRLRASLQRASAVLAGGNEEPEDPRHVPSAATASEAEASRDAQLWSGIETWLSDGDALIRQARAAALTGHHTTPPAGDKSLLPAPPSLPPPPSAAPPHR